MNIPTAALSPTIALLRLVARALHARRTRQQQEMRRPKHGCYQAVGHEGACCLLGCVDLTGCVEEESEATVGRALAA